MSGCVEGSSGTLSIMMFLGQDVFEEFEGEAE